MLIGLPATVAPLIWSCGFWPWALAPASLIRAYFAPEKDSCSKVANGPPQVVSTPTLMASAAADGALAAVDEPPDAELLPLPPHAASVSAAAAATTAAPPRIASVLLEFRIEPPAPWAEG